MTSFFFLFRKEKTWTIFFLAFLASFCLHNVPDVNADDSEIRRSLRGLVYEIGGELELEYVDSEADGRILVDKNGIDIDQDPNPFPRMSIDKIVITPRVQLKTGILFKADLQVKSDGKIKLDEAWIKVPGFPFRSWLKFGLDDLFIKPDRKTESYPVVGHAFWQDEDLGLFMGGKGEVFYWRFSLTNGRRLKDRRISEDEVFPIATDDDDNDEANTNKQVGFGVGIDYAFKEEHQIDLLPFYYRSELSAKDLSYLQEISSYPTGDLQDDQRRYGLNLDYRLRNFAFFGQYIKGKDGAMDRGGWYVQPSYKIVLGYNRLASALFLIRYDEYNVDLARSPTDSRTWDRRTTTVAVISNIVKGFKVKIEYSFNDEKTGGPDVDNNALLVQLELKF